MHSGPYRCCCGDYDSDCGATQNVAARVCYVRVFPESSRPFVLCPFFHRMPIHHLGSVVLESERLLLRPFVLEDAPAMFKYASDKESTQFMRFSTHQSIQDSKDIINIWVKESANPAFYNWAIVCKECNELIGSIGLVDVNEFHLLAEVGYILRRDHWRKGLATEALSTVIRFWFVRLGMNRLESCHSIENPASGRVMEKAGMVREGVKREYFPTDHGFVDCPIYAITRSDYDTLVAMK